MALSGVFCRTMAAHQRSWRRGVGVFLMAAWCFTGVFRTASAQPVAPRVQWSRLLGSQYAATARAVRQTSDGGYIVVGTGACRDKCFGLYLVKTDERGDVEWEQTLSGATEGRSVLETDNGFLTVGSTLSAHDDFDLYLASLDPKGELFWERTFGGAQDDFGRSVVEIEGGFAAGGIYARSEAYLIEVDFEGRLLSEHTYSRADFNAASVLQRAPGGGYVLGGYSLVRIGADGETLWEKTFQGSILSLDQAKESGYIVSGTLFTRRSGADAYLLRVDGKGNVLWEQSFGGRGGQSGRSVQQTSDGGFALAGLDDSSVATGYGVYILKTDARGELLWEKTLAPEGGIGGNSLRQTRDGGYIVAGGTGSAASLVKLGPERSGGLFRRGDPDEDGVLSIADAVLLLHALFGAHGGVECADAADADDSGFVDLSDGIFLLNTLFRRGSLPPPPFARCGLDPTADDLSCESFAGCG